MTTIAELLAGLGDTPDAVAAALRAAGCKGRRRCEGGECPVEAWFAAAGLDVCVSPTLAWVVGAAGAELPAPVAGFVARFDAGRYPDLVAEGGAG